VDTGSTRVGYPGKYPLGGGLLQYSYGVVCSLSLVGPYVVVSDEGEISSHPGLFHFPLTY
jgi:hypothetical protein